MNSEDLLEWIWEGRAKKKVLLISLVQSLKGRSNIKLSLKDLQYREEGGNPFPTRALWFCSKASLWLPYFTYSLIRGRSTGATDTDMISMSYSAKVIGAGPSSSVI